VNRLAPLALLLVAMASSPQPTVAIETSTAPADVPALPVEAGTTLSLTLEDAYAIALQRNLDLQVGRYSLAALGQGVLARSGVFDPSLTAGASISSMESPAVSELEGAEVAESQSNRYDLGLAQVLPTGTQLGLQLASRRTYTNNVLYFLNPSWNSSLTLSVTQPLLNGFGTLVNRSGILIAANLREQSAAGFSTQVVATLQSVERAYWDLVAAREEVGVKQQSLDLAARLLDETRQRVDVGTSAPIDLVQSEAGVATRRQELIYARNAAANAEDALKALLGFDTPDEWTTAIATTDSYEADTIHTDLAASIETALAKRPEMEQQRLALESSELEVKLARNAVLPRVDLEGSYGYAGIGGRGENVDGSVDDSWRQIRDTDFPSWSTGISLSVPLGNNDARSSLAQRRFEVEQGKVELAKLKQSIIHEVRIAVRALDDGAAAVEAAVASRELAQRNLEAEQTKFANGLSTNYLVLQVQEDLALAQLSELNARIGYRKVIAGYLTATGALLESHQIRIEDPAQPAVPHDYWKDVSWLQFSDLSQCFGKEEPPQEPSGPAEQD